jgi:hypothetical protein
MVSLERWRAAAIRSAGFTLMIALIPPLTSGLLRSVLRIDLPTGERAGLE